MDKTDDIGAAYRNMPKKAIMSSIHNKIVEKEVADFNNRKYFRCKSPLYQKNLQIKQFLNSY